MRRRTVLLLPLLAIDDWDDWVDDWNRLARLGSEYARAMNENRVDDALRVLPRVKAAGRQLFCNKKDLA